MKKEYQATEMKNIILAPYNTKEEAELARVKYICCKPLVVPISIFSIWLY